MIRFLSPLFPPTRTVALAAAIALCSAAVVRGQVVINEIHYHPVEEPAFDASGVPAVDLTDDVHEFIEIHNAGASNVDLSGWKLSGGIDFTFPAGTTLLAGGFTTVAKSPTRMDAVYGAPATPYLGPYLGKLGNNGDTVRLKNSAGQAVDAVSYSSQFPWAISANALGAARDWTGLDPVTYQYKGRSLQRVAVSASSNDPANWLASPLPAGPTPGAANAVTLSAPKPVVVAISAAQNTDGAAIIRANVQVRVDVAFSGGASLSEVAVEYFIDSIESFVETRQSVAMADLGHGRFSAILPGQVDRSIVRYRILANRGDAVEPVSPRADDPAIVPVTATSREGWHAYFVSPNRTSIKPIYECFVSNANLAQLNTNIVQNPKRVTSADPNNGLPREIPHVAPTAPQWNGTRPAIFIQNGIVRDAQIRYHGSRYNRNAGRKSYKLLFADFQKYLDADSIFITDKGNAFIVGQGLFIAAGLPISNVRYVDWFLNNDAGIQRLEQGEYNGDLLDLYHEKIQRQNPGSVKEATGEYYKSVGTIETQGEGPYGRGDERRLFTGGRWSALQRYEWTYGLQNHAWRGSKPIKDFIEGMWAARGDTEASPNNPNLENVRAWMLENVDVETTLTSMALLNWMCPWDDTTQNHFLWRRANGKWSHVPWDFDGFFGSGDNTGSGSSIYLGEVGLPSVFPGNNSRGPNFFKDSFIKAFRTEFKQRIWELSNSFLDPANLTALGFGSFNGFAAARRTSINTQTGLGTYYKPARPINQQPPVNGTVLPNSSFTTSAYAHSNTASPSPHTRTKWEIRSASGSYDDPVFVFSSSTDLTTLPIPFDQLIFGQGYFWRVTYLDAENHPSIVSAETRFDYGASFVAAGEVVINEVLVENRTAIANGGRYPDYLELKNKTAAPVDIGGWTLTDDPQVTNRYVFPAGTSIPANGYLIVWCDNDTFAPGLHTGFALSSGGQIVTLTQNGSIRDTIAFGPQIADLSIGRIADGSGGFLLNRATPGASNSAWTPLGAATSVRINEWMADTNDEDWFELYNAGPDPVAIGSMYLSDTPSTPLLTRIPPLSFIGGKGFADFAADGSTAGASHTDFRLSSGGDTIVLTDTNGSTVLDTVTFGTQQTDTSQGRIPDGAATILSFARTPTRGTANYLEAPVVINEVLTASTPPLEDAIELYNPTAGPVDISGWWLSDDRGSLQKFQIPPGTSIPAGGFRVFYESQFNPTPGLGNSFSLSSLGDEIILSAIDGTGALTGYRSPLRFIGAPDGVSFGRVVTSHGSDFFPQVARSFGRDNPATVEEFRGGAGSANGAPRNGPLVLNEIMYHPPNLPGGADDSAHEFIELHNVTNGAIDLGGWILRDGVDFTFPSNVSVPAGGYLVVVSFDPVNTAALEAFRTRYQLDAALPIYGPYTARLLNSSTNVELARPGTPVAGETPFLLIDRVTYDDTAPWPADPDGGGPSLQRLRPTAFGNDPANWTSQPPTPGLPYVDPSAPPDADRDGAPDAWETANGFDLNDPADAALDADADGQANGREFAAGTNPRNANSVLRAEVALAPAGGTLVRFLGMPGKAYTVQYCDDLAAGVWQKLRDIPAEVEEHPVEVADPAAVNQRFYRLVTPPTP